MKLQYQNFLIVAIILCFALSGKAQSEFSSEQIENLLNKAEKATQEYSETFKNLSAEESKTFEDYGKENVLERISQIKSTFIVYQSPKNGEVNEFRNVLEYNGKNVAMPDAEIQKLFERLSTEDSVGDEWKKIIEEGVRFDGKSSAWGMTLWQAAPLGELRPYFDYSVAGKDHINGRDVLVVEYRQTKPTLLIKFNPSAEDWKKEPRDREYYANVSSGLLRSSETRLTGKMWLDAETAQIWRNESKIVIYPAHLSYPLTALEFVFEYQPSKFNILVPKSFVYTFYKISGSNNKNVSVEKDRVMQFEYSKFSKFKLEMKIYEITGNKSTF